MKKVILFSTLLFTFFNCSVRKKPEFLRIEQITVIDSNSRSLILSANAFFKNPNDVGGELKTDAIKVYVNNNEVATVSSESFEVPAQDEFAIPLKAVIPTDSLISDKNLSGLLGSLFNQSIKVQYKGDIIYKVLGFTHAYTVDETDEIKIKF